MKNWLYDVPSPSYVVDEGKLFENLHILKQLEEDTGCHVLLAQKAFSMYSLYPLISDYLSGTTSSGLYEAKLAHEEFKGDNHIFSAAYRDDEFPQILELCDHIVFNSISQLKKFGIQTKHSGRSYGLRINPEFSTMSEEHAIYDPCSKESRLGVKLAEFEEALAIEGNPEKLFGLEGLHFHALCEQGSEDLVLTLDAVEASFGKYLYHMKWINLGGGHHITKEGYDIDLLCNRIEHLRNKYGLEVYIEPGEAVALNAGYLVTTVLDIIPRGNSSVAILDTSAACHMPDVLEMPYRPPLADSGDVGELTYSYILAGPTCLAGDIIGRYTFDSQLEVGDRLMFEDMAIYTMVKNNTFNGMPLPAIMVADADGNIRTVKTFGYEDFKMRL